MDQPIKLLIIAIILIFLVNYYSSETYINPLPYHSFYESLDDHGKDFLYPIPYNNLETTHYNQMYQNKTTPCNPEENNRGYHKNFVDYFERPDMLKSFYLGYSISGQPYNDMQKPTVTPKSGIDLKHLPSPNYYEKEGWIKYNPAPKEAFYYGYPFHFHGKQNR